MDYRLFFTIFLAVLFAELGDKTQLATLLFATNKDHSGMTVFLASALALIIASGIAVLLGHTVSGYVSPKFLAWIAGAGFIVIGIWTIIFRA